MFYIEIKGDINDGDYVSEINEISAEDVELVKSVVAAVKKFKKAFPYQNNWPNHEYADETVWDWYKKEGITEEQFELMSCIAPGASDYPIHSIETINIYEVSNVENLL